MSDNKKKYNSPYSVARRKTTFIDSKDPRAKGSKSNVSGTNQLNSYSEKFRSKAGSDVIVQDNGNSFKLVDYINQCIYDSLEVMTYSEKTNSLSDTIFLENNNYYTDNISEVLFNDVEQIFLSETILAENSNLYSDLLTPYIPSELFEVFLYENQNPDFAIVSDNSAAQGNPPIVEIYYYITYDGNGKDAGSAPVDAYPHLDGSVVTVLDSGTLVKNGYAFTGWNTSQYGNGITYQPGSTVVVNSDITLYAIWTNVYQVVYSGNQNDEGVVPIDSNLYFTGDVATILGQGTVIKYGKTFDGWNTQENGSGTTYQVGNTITITNTNINLYAKWI